MGFWLIGLWAILTAIELNRTYKDSWLGKDIWPFLFALILLYSLYFVLSDNNERAAWLAVGLVFFLNSIPAIKYAYIYGNAIDQAVHLSSIRYIQNFGMIEPNSVYQYTPGFHVITSLFSDIAGLSPTIASKIISASLGCFIPFGFYLYCKHYRRPTQLTKWVLFFSGFSFPLLYVLNGSTFSTPIFILVIMMIVIRENEDVTSIEKRSYTFLILLFFLLIVLFHPSTTIVLIASLILSGLVGLVIEKI